MISHKLLISLLLKNWGFTLNPKEVELALKPSDGLWPDPSRAYFWPAVNKRPTHLCPGYFWPQGEKNENFGEIFLTWTHHYWNPNSYYFLCLSNTLKVATPSSMLIKDGFGLTAWDKTLCWVSRFTHGHTHFWDPATLRSQERLDMKSFLISPPLELANNESIVNLITWDLLTAPGALKTCPMILIRIFLKKTLFYYLTTTFNS